MAENDLAVESIAALRNSHERLVSLVEGLEPDRLKGPSFCSDWNVAQVLSHLGSGAEIFSLFISAGLAGEDPPGNELFPAIWDAWNAKEPERQAHDALGSDAALLEQFESLDPDQRAEFHLSMFGMEVDLPTLVGMRLSEHALHSWDIAVAVDAGAQLLPDATSLLVDALPQRVARGGKAVGGPFKVKIKTTSPERSYLLSVDDSVSLEESTDDGASGEGDGGGAATLVLPAEAFIRLIAGRLDSQHVPKGVSDEGGTLDALRAVFPGF